MFLIVLLGLMLTFLIAFTVLAVAAGGAFVLIVLADVIVLIMFIGWLIKRGITKKARRAGKNKKD